MTAKDWGEPEPEHAADRHRLVTDATGVYTLYIDEAGTTGGITESPRLWYFVLGAAAIDDGLVTRVEGTFASAVRTHSERSL
jgi:hypothetical protein